MISRAIVLIFTLLSLGCNAHKPQAELQYQKFERIDRKLYTIHYTSNMNLLHIFSRSDGDNQLVTRLICSLGNDLVFSADHVIEQKFSGNIYSTGEPPGPPFEYATHGYFTVTHDGGSSEKDLSDAEIQSSLLQQHNVTCKANITVFGYKAYYSKPMLIPVKDILDELARKPG